MWPSRRPSCVGGVRVPCRPAACFELEGPAAAAVARPCISKASAARAAACRACHQRARGRLFAPWLSSSERAAESRSGAVGCWEETVLQQTPTLRCGVPARPGALKTSLVYCSAARPRTPDDVVICRYLSFHAKCSYRSPSDVKLRMLKISFSCGAPAFPSCQGVSASCCLGSLPLS